MLQQMCKQFAWQWSKSISALYLVIDIDQNNCDNHFPPSHVTQWKSKYNSTSRHLLSTSLHLLFLEICTDSGLNFVFV